MIRALDASSSDDDSDTATKRDLDKMMRDIKKANEKLLTKLSDAMDFLHLLSQFLAERGVADATARKNNQWLGVEALSLRR